MKSEPHTVTSGEQSFQWLSTSNQKLLAKYSCYSRAGADPYGRAKRNQDSYVVTEFMGGSNACFFGVFDGHGGDGGKVSRHLVERMPPRLASSPCFKAQQFRELFATQLPLCNRELLATPGIRTELSGSTAITALLHDSGLLTVANVGDSRCILGRVEGSDLQAVALNTEHTPEVPSEAARITSRRGRIRPYMVEGENVGPKRIWLPNRDTPGLCMTRAFGDAVGASVGVIPDPEILQVMLCPDDKYLILCSDGIFEFMDSDFIMALVHLQAQQGLSASEIAQSLVEEAARQWMEEEDGIIDDCTVILVMLDFCRENEPVPAPATPRGKERLGSMSKAISAVARKATNLMSPADVLQKARSSTKAASSCED